MPKEKIKHCGVNVFKDGSCTNPKCSLFKPKKKVKIEDEGEKEDEKEDEKVEDGAVFFVRRDCVCKHCKQPFGLTEAEKNYFKERDLCLPKVCKDCRHYTRYTNDQLGNM